MRGKLYIARDHNRPYLRGLVTSVPDGHEIVIREPTRTLNQNDALWAICTDLANARPEGITATPEDWKCLLMHSCGHAARFLQGLDGQHFPVGFRSSHLNKSQMADLITFAKEYGDRHGVVWGNEARAA